MKRILVIIMIVLALSFGLMQFIPVFKQADTVFLKEGKRPLVIAHRGGAALAPENTLLAFRVAEKIGVDAIELDVRMTRDKKLAVIHDPTIDRTTNGKGRVADMTLKEVKQYDAGYRLKTKEGSFPFRNKGVDIPALEEVFKTIKNVPLIIEMKDPSPLAEQEIAKLIKKYKMKNRVIVGSFNDESLKRLSAAAKSIPIGTGIKTVKMYLILQKLHLERLYPLDRHAVQIPTKAGDVNLASKDFIQSVQERNIAVHYWTINDQETMKKLIQLRVDGIITDYPHVLLKILSELKKEV